MVNLPFACLVSGSLVFLPSPWNEPPAVPSYCPSWFIPQCILNAECFMIAQLAELTDEVAGLPGALHSTTPDLLVDYLAATFKEGDSNAISW